MDEKEDSFDEEDYDIDALLAEEDDSPIEEVAEEIPTEPKKKSRGRPKGTVKRKEEPKKPIEVAETEKDLMNMEWQSFSQLAYDGYQNSKTGEIIDEKEALRRTLNYAQDAARNSR